jgi:hypothetical protein
VLIGQHKQLVKYQHEEKHLHFGLLCICTKMSIKKYRTNFLPQVPLPSGNEKIEEVDVNFSTHQK